MERDIWVPLLLLVAGQVIATFIAKRKSIDTNTFTNLEMKTDIRYIKENLKKALNKSDKNECEIIVLKESDKNTNKRIDKNTIEIEKNRKEIDKLKERRDNNG